MESILAKEYIIICLGDGEGLCGQWSGWYYTNCEGLKNSMCERVLPCGRLKHNWNIIRIFIVRFVNEYQNSCKLTSNLEIYCIVSIWKIVLCGGKEPVVTCSIKGFVVECIQHIT